MIELHPEILKKNGHNEFVVLPYEEYVEVIRALEDADDILALREARESDDGSPGCTIEEARRELGV